MASSTPISTITTSTTTKPVGLNIIVSKVATNSVSTTTSSTQKVITPESQSKSFSEEYGGIIKIVIWPIFALIIIYIFLIIFRKQISRFLDRCNKIKVPWVDFDASSSSKEQDRKEEKKEEEQMPPSEIEEEEKDTKTEEPKTAAEWRMDMVFSALDKKLERFEAAYKELMRLDQETGIRNEDEILYLKLSHTVGKIDTIKKIEIFLEDKSLEFRASMAIGYCYDYSKDFNNADSFYSRALSVAHTDEEKSSAVISYSETLYKNDKKIEALKILGDVLLEIKEDSQKVDVYKSMANIYEKEKDYENRAFVLDKAIELEPNNYSLMFGAGYSYAESKYDELSLFHYKNAKAINPEDDSVQNNLGVQYDNLGMPIKSIESYQEAVKLNNTLANANIAYRLMNAGFMSEAKIILDSVKNTDNVHPNVNSALSEIPKKIENENQVEAEKLRIAIELRKFFLEYINAKMISSDVLKSISGDWKSEDGVLYHVDVTGNRVLITWGRKRLSVEFKYKFEGTITNNSCVLEFYDHAYMHATPDDEFVKNKDKGYLFCSLAGDKISFIKVNDSYQSKKIQILTKANK